MNTAIDKKEIEAFLINVLKNDKQIDVSAIDMSHLLSSLDIDSFGFLEIIFSIEHEYNVSFPKNYDNIKTMQNVIDVTYDLINEKANA
jgi:acyl carrier protein